MIQVYSSSLALLVFAYISQTYIRGHAGPDMLFSFGLFLMLISWSVVAESVVFATVSKNGSNTKDPTTNATQFLINILRDQVVVSCVLIIALLYFFYQKHIGVMSIAMTIVVAITFLLRIAESSAKSSVSRLGNHKKQQIITNICASFKWFAIVLAAQIQSEFSIYAASSFISVVAIVLLIRCIHLERQTVKESKSLDSYQERWLMLVATIIGVMSYQLDKMIGLHFLDNSVAGAYVLSYSLIFILIQMLTPLYNKYVSDGWANQDHGEKNSDSKKYFLGVFSFLAYTGAILNLLLIVCINLYFDQNLYGRQDLIDLVLLTIAVYLCAINHIYYYNFIIERKYQFVLYQNLTGFFFGSFVGIISIALNFKYGLAIIPLFVTLGQFFYIIIISFKLENHKKNKNSNIINDIKLMNILFSVICIITTGTIILYGYSMQITKHFILVIPALLLVTSLYFMRIALKGSLLKSLKLILNN
jgi:hypothetical protein